MKYVSERQANLAKAKDIKHKFLTQTHMQYILSHALKEMYSLKRKKERKENTLKEFS